MRRLPPGKRGIELYLWLTAEPGSIESFIPRSSVLIDRIPLRATGIVAKSAGMKITSYRENTKIRKFSHAPFNILEHENGTTVHRVGAVFNRILARLQIKSANGLTKPERIVVERDTHGEESPS
jgi:hypothetical protein